jgi:signal transduction histidine kinase
LRHLLERLVALQEEERRRVARDLHDVLGQRVTAMRLRIEMLKATHGTRGAQRALDDLLELIDRMDREVDFVMTELRPPALDEFGLVAALNLLVNEWSRLDRLIVDFDPTGFTGRIDPRIEDCLYRITQEALNNVFKHARASHACVVLKRRTDEVVLIVEDDGCGFERRRGARAPKSVCFGLTGMRERTRIVDGRFKVEATPGKGTRVFVAVPTIVANSRALRA